MSWLFSQALVEAFSAATCSAGAASALSSGTPTPRAFLPPDKMTDFSRPSRFGMTFGPLTDDLGEGLLTWFRADFLAKTSASPETETDWTASDPASGPKWRGSLARYDPDLRSWKTAQHSLLGGSEEFSETWPRWGTTVGGELYLLPALVPPHRRERIWVLAYSMCGCRSAEFGEQQGQWASLTDSGGEGNVANSGREHVERLIACGLDPKEWAQQGERPVGSQGYGDGWWATEPDMGRVAHGMAARVDRLTAIGNGQVPQAAALAWRTLTGDLK